MSYIQAAVSELATVLGGKNKDYAPTTEFSNFDRAAEFAGTDVDTVILTQIAIKYTRLQTLAAPGNPSPNFEGIRDTLMDLAGYAIIGVARMTVSLEMDYVDIDG